MSNDHLQTRCYTMSLLLLTETMMFVCLCVCSRTPLATFHEGKHNIAHMDMDPSRGLMVTCGSDRIVKVNKSPLIAEPVIHVCFCVVSMLSKTITGSCSGTGVLQAQSQKIFYFYTFTASEFYCCAKNVYCTPILF